MSGTAEHSRIFALWQEGLLILWSLPLPALQVSVSINKDIAQKKETQNSPLSEVSGKKSLIHSQPFMCTPLWVQERPFSSARAAFKEGDGSVPAEKSFRVSAENFFPKTACCLQLNCPHGTNPSGVARAVSAHGCWGSAWACHRQKQPRGEGSRRQLGGQCSPKDTLWLQGISWKKPWSIGGNGVIFLH